MKLHSKVYWITKNGLHIERTTDAQPTGTLIQHAFQAKTSTIAGRSAMIIQYKERYPTFLSLTNAFKCTRTIPIGCKRISRLI